MNILHTRAHIHAAFNRDSKHEILKFILTIQTLYVIKIPIPFLQRQILRTRLLTCSLS